MTLVQPVSDSRSAWAPTPVLHVLSVGHRIRIVRNLGDLGLPGFVRSVCLASLTDCAESRAIVYTAAMTELENVAARLPTPNAAVLLNS